MPQRPQEPLSYPQNQAFRLILGVFFILSIGLTSCDKTINISDFDSSLWKKDTKGCTGYRLSKASLLKKNETLLIGKHENTITQLLGHPDKLDLGKKMNRTAVYIIENPTCTPNGATQHLILDFNSMSQVRQVMIQNN